MISAPPHSKSSSYAPVAGAVIATWDTSKLFRKLTVLCCLSLLCWFKLNFELRPQTYLGGARTCLIKKYILPYFLIPNETNFILGRCEVNLITALKVNSRFPEYSMTNDPEKVWPGGIVYYWMDTSIGKRLITAFLAGIMLA